MPHSLDSGQRRVRGGVSKSPSRRHLRFQPHLLRFSFSGSEIVFRVPDPAPRTTYQTWARIVCFSAGGEKGAGLGLRVEGVGVRTRLEGFVESCCSVPTYIRVYHVGIGF